VGIKKLLSTLKNPLLLLMFLVFITGCNLPTFGAFKGATSQARDEEKLWAGMVIAAIVVGIIVWALIFWSAFRYKRKKGDDSIPRQFTHHSIIEIIYTVIPIIIVLVVFGFTYVTENEITALKKDPALQVHIVAFQWGWEFHYYNYEGHKVNATVIGNYNAPPVAPMPAGQTIQVWLTSNDVVHGFYVPKFNFSRYAQPGFNNYFDLNILKPGIYPGRCTQLCGVYHTQMKFTINAETPSEFGKWLTEHSKG
jgi:cytochrome c oxidase subunit 2